MKHKGSRHVSRDVFFGSIGDPAGDPSPDNDPGHCRAGVCGAQAVVMDRKRLVFLLPMALLLASSAIPQQRVYSQTATDTPVLTPTITAPPPYQPSIATSPSYDDLSCPTGAVVGYGTTTPSSAWNLLCSKCVVTPLTTSTAQPTVTPTPYTFNTAFPPICVTAAGSGVELCYTATAGISTPTNTPIVINTPMGTAQPTEVAYPEIHCSALGTGCTQVNSSTVRISFNLSHPFLDRAIYMDAKYYYSLPVAGILYLGITYTTGSVIVTHVGNNGHEVIDIGFRTENIYQYLSYVPTTMTFQNFNTAVESSIAGSQNLSFYDYGGSDHAIQLVDGQPWSLFFRTVDVTTDTVVTLSTNPDWATVPTPHAHPDTRANGHLVLLQQRLR